MKFKSADEAKWWKAVAIALIGAAREDLAPVSGFDIFDQCDIALSEYRKRIEGTNENAA